MANSSSMSHRKRYVGCRGSAVVRSAAIFRVARNALHVDRLADCLTFTEDGFALRLGQHTNALVFLCAGEDPALGNRFAPHLEPFSRRCDNESALRFACVIDGAADKQKWRGARDRGECPQLLDVAVGWLGDSSR